jgi:LVIVD repeat
MKIQELVKSFAVATVALPVLLLSASLASAQAISSDGFLASVPKAHCGPRDHIESGLQGETTQQERFSGDSETAYNCNLELMGEEDQNEYQGAYSQDGPAYYDVCAYYGTDSGPKTGQGIKAIDVSNPRHPRVTANLTDSPAALAPHETLSANAKSRLLVAGQTTGMNFAVYDISDCRRPVLKGSINASSSSFHHMGQFAPDGKTFYATQNFRGVGGFLYIFDLSDPANPKALPPWQYEGDGRPHSLNLNWAGFLPGVPEGTLLFAGQPGEFGAAPTDSSFGPDGLVIEDVSDYQFRRPNPKIRIISKLFWADQGQSESMIPVHINGHPYIITTDEAGGAGGSTGWAGACARGASPFGYPQIIDVADLRKPKIISKLRLQVSDPANCAALLAETPPDAPGTAPGTNLPAISGTTNYSEETCVPDNPEDTKMLACGFQNAQLRVFDVSEPTHPKEIAYWKSGAPRTKVLPASGSWAMGVDRTVDKIAHWVRWVVPGKDTDEDKGKDKDKDKDKGPGHEVQLWTVSDSHGFQVLRFSNSFEAQHRDLFAHTVTTEGPN